MDSLVQTTNDSSILSKLSMVRRGYFQDDVIHHFATKEVRRSPLIHLGYFARALVVDKYIRMFLESVTDPQILSLGAGFDTTFFRLQPSFPNVSYFEVDLPVVVRNKISIIKQSKELSSILSQGAHSTTESDRLSTERYSIFIHDLSTTEGLAEKLQLLGFHFDRPTLVFSECAITYIEEERSTNLIRWAAEQLPNGMFMNYEQFNPDDGFGQVMIAHFNKIQSPLRSLSVHKTLRDQLERYLKAGWTRCHVTSVMDLVRNILTLSELSKIFKKEPFDEWEEFHLKCCHYSLAVASHRTSIFPHLSPQLMCTAKGAIDVTQVKELKVERFGHTVNRLSDGAALVVGGFGAIPGYPHSRCGDIQYVGFREKRVLLVSQPRPGTQPGAQSQPGTHPHLSPTSASGTLGCLYHTCTPLGRDQFVLYGGRTSPARAVNSDPLLLTVIGQSANDLEVRVQDISLADDAKPPPRWRHAAVEFHGSLLVFGGRNKNVEVFGDLWELRPAGPGKWRWSEIRRRWPLQSWPKPRFSHAFASKDNSAYLSGGLDSEFKPLNDVWELTLIEGELGWKEIKPNLSIPHVYSHNMYCYKNKLLLLGGVRESPVDQPQLTVINLLSYTTHLYFLKVVGESHTFLLHNLGGIIAEEEDTIICYGGGGNCFSFGTHFNKIALKLSNMTTL